MSETNESLVRAAVAAFNDPSARERYFDLYAPDVGLHGYPDDLQGREGIRQFCTQLWAAVPDIHLSLEELLATSDGVAARWVLSGTQSGDFYGASGSGRETEVHGMIWLHFRDGLVTEAWQVSATLDTLARQSSRAAKAPPRQSAAAAAAALRWEETHPKG